MKTPFPNTNHDMASAFASTVLENGSYWRADAMKYDLVPKQERKMYVDERIRKAWIEIQQKHSAPVNAIGMKIDPKDASKLRVWKDAGIDQFVKK